MKVRLLKIDMYGLNGRDLHPRAFDQAAMGSVVDACCDHGGHEDGDGDICDPLIFYTVLLDGEEGRQVDVAEYECTTMSEREYQELNGNTAAHAGLVLARMIREVLNR